MASVATELCARPAVSSNEFIPGNQMSIVTEEVYLSGTTPTVAGGDPSDSALSWGAILAGAVLGAALTFLMLALGASAGLSMASAWPDGASVSGKTAGIIAALWLVLSLWIGFAAAGFIAGRTRKRGVGLRSLETGFRDCAHGAIVWAVGVLVSVFILGATSSSLISGGAFVASKAVQGANAASDSPVAQYYVDSLFRSGPNAPAPDRQAMAQSAAEATRILARGVVNGGLQQADRDYLVNMIATRAGISPDEARTRLDETEKQIRSAADTARKATAQATLGVFVALLLGAFASISAAYFGGVERDDLDRD
jgi:hypothetical protein